MNTVAFGELVRTYRKARGYSQRQVADMLGVNFTYICHIEAGRRSLANDAMWWARSFAEVLRAPVGELAGALGLPLGEVASEDWSSFEGLVGSDPRLRDDQREMLVRLYRQYVDPEG